MATTIIAFPEVIPASIEEPRNWYAVHTRARHEKLVAYRFQESGIETFLPLVNEVHRWSDRKKIVQSPLFSCYVFARICPTNVDRMRLLKAEGVLALVGKRGEGTPIADDQIESVKSSHRSADVVVSPSLSEDRPARTRPQRGAAWHGRNLALAQRRQDSRRLD